MMVTQLGEEEDPSVTWKTNARSHNYFGSVSSSKDLVFKSPQQLSAEGTFPLSGNHSLKSVLSRPGGVTQGLDPNTAKRKKEALLP